MRFLLCILVATLTLVSANHHACCFSNGDCRSINSFLCDLADGAYVGNEQPDGCDALESLCPGACCFPDHCDWVSEDECHGVYRGNGTICGSDCDGACCEDNVCSAAQEFDCGGRFHSIGTHCLPESQCPKLDGLATAALVFAALFFLIALLLCLFALRRNARS